MRLFSLHALCLGGSGALAKTAVAPLERIKAGSESLRHATFRVCKCSVKVQSLRWQSMIAHVVDCRLAMQVLLQVQRMSNVPREHQYKGLVHALRSIPAREGWQARCCAGLHWIPPLVINRVHATLQATKRCAFERMRCS